MAEPARAGAAARYAAEWRRGVTEGAQVQQGRGRPWRQKRRRADGGGSRNGTRPDGDLRLPEKKRHRRRSCETGTAAPPPRWATTPRGAGVPRHRADDPRRRRDDDETDDPTTTVETTASERRRRLTPTPPEVEPKEGTGCKARGARDLHQGRDMRRHSRIRRLCPEQVLVDNTRGSGA